MQPGDGFSGLLVQPPRAEALKGRRDVLVRIHGHEIEDIVDSYGYREPGELVVVVDSENYIKIAVVNGSAARTLRAQASDEVKVIYRD